MRCDAPGEVEFAKYPIRCRVCGRTDQCVESADRPQVLGTEVMLTSRRAPDGWGFAWRDGMPAWVCPKCREGLDGWD